MPSKRKPVRKVRCPKASAPGKSQSVKRHRSKSKSGKRHSVRSFCRSPSTRRAMPVAEPMMMMEEEMEMPMLAYLRKRRINRSMRR